MGQSRRREGGERARDEIGGGHSAVLRVSRGRGRPWELGGQAEGWPRGPAGAAEPGRCTWGAEPQNCKVSSQRPPSAPLAVPWLVAQLQDGDQHTPRCRGHRIKTEGASVGRTATRGVTSFDPSPWETNADPGHSGRTPSRGDAKSSCNQQGQTKFLSFRGKAEGSASAAASDTETDAGGGGRLSFRGGDKWQARRGRFTWSPGRSRTHLRLTATGGLFGLVGSRLCAPQRGPAAVGSGRGECTEKVWGRRRPLQADRDIPQHQGCHVTAHLSGRLTPESRRGGAGRGGVGAAATENGAAGPQETAARATV